MRRVESSLVQSIPVARTVYIYLENMEEVVVVLLLEQGVVLGVAPATAWAVAAGVAAGRQPHTTP